jgi:tripartite-type tricarboxylate transporter receptor subunit TctC
MNKPRVAAHRGVSLLKHALTLVGTLAATIALAGEPIEIIVPFGPTSGADTLARYCTPALQSALGEPVQVTNVPGSTGNQGIARLLAAPNDGRTLAVLTGDTYATLAYANPPLKSSDVIPVAIMMRQTSTLFVLESSRFAKWQDLEKEARARPRALRVAISGFGSPDYIALQQLDVKNIKLTPVPRLSPKDKYQALIDGEADAIYEQLGDVRSFVEAKQLRPILVFSRAQPGAASGGVPTSVELGLGNGLEQFRAFVVKAGTPRRRSRHWPRRWSALAHRLSSRVS